MNLDLNLGPLLPPSPGVEQGSGSLSSESVTLGEWIEEPVQRLPSAVRFRRRQRWRWRIPPEARMEFIGNHGGVDGGGGGGIGGGGGLQTGEGSVAAEERTNEVIKMCESNINDVENEALGKKEDVEKGSSDGASFFDCNICLDLAKDPVLTCCGHLYCWPCLYRWLHIHSDVKECPVCKGEVTDKSVTPIFGRWINTRKSDEDSSLKIPPRPSARRIESLRQTIQRNPFSIPMEEMIRRIGSRFDLTLPSDPDGARDTPERNTSFLNRILTSRGRREQNGVGVASPDEVVDLTQSSATSFDENRRNHYLQSLLLRRPYPYRTDSLPPNSADERLVGILRDHAIIRSREQALAPQVDDRDSVSSIAAGIHSESQTMDTAMEIDSLVSLSTSSSRRRNDGARVSDVDSGDSRAPRRRRLNS